MRKLLSYLLLAFLWLLHFLPLSILRRLGHGLGLLLLVLGRERRRVVRINLRLCFPEWDTARRERVLRLHFILFAQAFLDRTLLWWASRSRLGRCIRLVGRENLERGDGLPTLLLAPHFVGLDAGGTAITMITRLTSIYSRQKNPVFDAMFLAGRQRFNGALLLSRQEGVRRALKAMKRGMPFYYLPDLDFGRRESIFVPFFGVPAATITGVSRLARATGARVVPCVSRLARTGYVVELLPPWENFPGESVEADTAFVNRFIESQVRICPAQYHWLHKRFKTRPRGEMKIY
ncbi:MAG: lipid A biosynthesis acyltransferase [Zoogloeaceae bacterium]|jgi:KDO2-lipid IV(A) lauroyltransferase|nr:lipid A biosynthesis acyltransferase [Zoogloeaceae bacterium]